MGKKFIQTITIEELRAKAKSSITNYFYRMWLSRYKFPQLDRQQKRFIMKKFWMEGKVACFKIPHLDGAESLGFSNFIGVEEKNLYDEDVKVNLVYNKNISFVPKGMLTVNEDVVLGWANSSRTPIKKMLEFYIDRMVECELILHNNLITAQLPFMVQVSPEQKEKATDLLNKLFNFEPVLFTESDVNTVASIMTGSPWIADKIKGLEYSYQSEALTILGCDNTKMDSSDKQFQLTSELQSNCAEINVFKADFDDCIQDFLDEISDTFGVTITKEDNIPETEGLYEEGEYNGNPTKKEEVEE